MEPNNPNALDDRPVPGIIGSSQAIREVWKQIRLAAKGGVDARVIIFGESGTGKELIARAIHQYSDRASKPFVALNCGAVPQELIESELFGHVKGAFTGAHSDSPGQFLRADKGIIFLDEVAEMSDAMQVKLLRVLQEREVQRIGCTKPPRRIDVRVITATNKCLLTLVEEKRFRQDLYYRLCGIHIFAPALRDRADDIPELVRYIMEKHLEQRRTLTVEDDAMKLLCSYQWPGNVRELEAKLQFLLLATTGPSITAKAVSDVLKDPRHKTTISIAASVPNRDKRIEMPTDGTMDILPAETRKQWHERLDGLALELSLQTCKNRTDAAGRLGLTRGAFKKALLKKRHQHPPETDPESGPSPHPHEPAA